jgi:hypothetical protein
MRSENIALLILVALLLLSMKLLKVPTRNISFGVILGFAWQALNDLLFSTRVVRHQSLYDHSQFIYESITLAGMWIWVAYFALPAREPASRLPQAEEFDGAMTQLQ